MSLSTAAGSQPTYSSINTGRMHQADVRMRRFGQTYIIGDDTHKGCFWRANLVIIRTLKELVFNSIGILKVSYLLIHSIS